MSRPDHRRTRRRPGAASTTSPSSAGELAEYVLLVGDPGRVAKVSSRWDGIELERSNREITTATGTYRGMRISCMSTGMGTDNVEIVLAEVMEITDARRPSSASAPRERSSRRSSSET